jgi:sugar phosphate permease
VEKYLVCGVRIYQQEVSFTKLKYVHQIDIIGGVLASVLLYAGLNWAFVFFVPGIYTFLYGFLVLGFAKNKPTDVGLISSDDIEKDDYVNDNPFDEDLDAPIGFIQAWMIPGVAAYAFAFAFLKLVMYSFLFWLPFYMSQGKYTTDL